MKYISITMYAEVIGELEFKLEDGSTLEELNCRDVHTGLEFSVQGESLIHRTHNTFEFNETKKVTMTNLAEILVGAGDKVFTATFIKKDGTERVLKGRLIKPEPLMGRSMVEDFEEKDKNGKPAVKQIDHRTLQSIVIGRTRYELK